MPTYQYACTEPDCGNRFELVQSFTDPSVSECPVCNGAVRKVYGSVGVVFKGSGFYRNDSRSSSGSGDSGGSSKSESKADSSSSSSSSSSDSKSSSSSSDSKVSKPAAKSESAPSKTAASA
jgi:putative FmdB family regulatory protein